MKFASGIVPLTIRMQISNILPIFIISGIMALCAYLVTFISAPNIIRLIIGVLVGISVYVVLLKIFQNDLYTNIKQIIIKSIIR